FGTDDDFEAETFEREWFLPFKVIIGDALHALEDYPATQPELEDVLGRNGVRLAGLHDPWGSPLRTAIRHELARRIVEIQRAGPDRKFGTADDFEVMTYSGTFFSAMTVKMESVLQAAAEFPTNPDQLRSALKAAGIQLDELRDPWDKPYE